MDLITSDVDSDLFQLFRLHSRDELQRGELLGKDNQGIGRLTWSHCGTARPLLCLRWRSQIQFQGPRGVQTPQQTALDVLH